jgi:hypothetical protein
MRLSSAVPPLIGRLAIIALILGCAEFSSHGDEPRPISFAEDTFTLKLEVPSSVPFQILQVEPGSTFQSSLFLAQSSPNPVSSFSLDFEDQVITDQVFVSDLPTGWVFSFSDGILSAENTGSAGAAPLNGLLGSLSFQLNPDIAVGTEFNLPSISNIQASDVNGNSLDAGPGLRLGVEVEVVPEPAGIGLMILGLIALILLLRCRAKACLSFSPFLRQGI